MARKRTDTDPYAPPPMYHDRSGRFVRIGLIAVLLAAVGIGYFIDALLIRRDLRASS